MMKDIRLIQLPNGKIGVFTRSQGGIYERGRIGYLEISSFDQLNPNSLLKGKIIEGQFDHGQWGGVNQLHLLGEDKIGVLGHIVYEDSEGMKHYYAMVFVYYPKKHFATRIKIIAVRNNFPEVPAKRPDLKDLIFPGGLVQEDQGATFFAELSDTEAEVVRIKDPFLAYREN